MFISKPRYKVLLFIYFQLDELHEYYMVQQQLREGTINLDFFAPALKDREHIVLLLSVCLHVKT